MQATAFPYAGPHAIVPLLELALRQTNGNGAYLYRLSAGEPFARLAAWAGFAPSDSDWRDLKAAGHILRRPSAVAVQDRAWQDRRFESLAEFRRHRFPGVVSMPLQ